MNVVKVRSPFIITVAETGQTGSKIELSIWQKGNLVPTSGQGFYSLSKSIPSPTQISTYYNVSNYVKEFIDNIKPTQITGITPIVEDNNEWVNFRVKRFKLVGSTYTELDSTDYVGVNGFTNYSDGYQNPTNINGMVLTNETINKSILKTSSTSKGYFNFLFDLPSGGFLSYAYLTLDESSSSSSSITGLSSGIYNYKVPLTIYPDDSLFIDGCKVRVRVVNSTPAIIYEKIITVNSIDEYKYTPVKCSFINRFGGWEFVTFFKSQSNSVSVKNTNYKTNTALTGQSKIINVNGKQTVKLNTGWVNENFAELITDLILSERVLLDEKPVTVKTQSFDLKSVLKDKMINYEVEFELDYNLINDVI